MNKCIFYRSVSRLENPGNCDFLCSRTCEVMIRYKELLNSNKINIIDDIANFRVKKHKNKRSDK